jgi:hypothetical protein
MKGWGQKMTEIEKTPTQKIIFNFFSESPKSESDNSPHFDVYRVENHTVQLGGIAFLPCIIKNLGNKSVRDRP